MTEDEILWQFSREQRDIGTAMDNQRIAISNFILTLSAGITALISVDKLEIDKRPLSIIVILLGIYGIITTRKLYERSMFHFSRSRECIYELDRMVTNGKILRIKEFAEQKNNRQFPLLSKVRNHIIWMGLHILIVTLGSVLLYSTC